jgi:hypothetical protein
MKTLKQKFSALSLIVLVSLASVMSTVPVYAAAASITLSGNRSQVAAGGSYVVAVYMNGGGTPINGVEADVSYSSSQFQYIGISYGGSPFSVQAGAKDVGGVIDIPVGTISPISGSALVATLTFRALASSGSASFGIASSSSLVNANDNSAVDFGTGGDSVKFGTAAAAPASPTAGPSSVTPTAPVAPAPPKDTTAPVISIVKIKTSTPYSAVITWTTNEPADSAVDYGLDANYGLSVSQPGLTSTHEVTLTSSFLTPKALLHFRVKSADGVGNVQTGSDLPLQLPGVPVSIVIRGEDGKPQPDAIVTLDNQTATTDMKGQATLQASLGSKQVVITYGGVTVRRTIMVDRSAKPLPPYKLDLAKQPINHWMLTSAGLLVVVLTLLAIDAVLFGSTFVMKLVSWRRSNTNTTPVAATFVSAVQTEPAPSLHPAYAANANSGSNPVNGDTSHPEVTPATTVVPPAIAVAERLKPRAKASNPKPIKKSAPTIRKSA